MPLWVAYYRRRLPRFLKIKELLDSSAIGDVRSVMINYQRTPFIIDGDLPWQVQPAISGGGLFADIGVHMLDILDFLINPIGSAQGFAVNQAGAILPRTTWSEFPFRFGVVGVGSWCLPARFGTTKRS